jgi:hypothetical protein
VYAIGTGGDCDKLESPWLPSVLLVVPMQEDKSTVTSSSNCKGVRSQKRLPVWSFM